MLSLTVLLILLVSVQSLVTKPNSDSDLVYVFAYSWTPEFCYDENYPGCLDPETYWEKYFTVHGLWPQYEDSGYPSFCTDEPFDPAVPQEVGWDDMTTYWPSVQYNETDPDYDSFWEHEWTKHGTCSGLSQISYFQATINLIKKFGTPSSYTAAVGSNISATELRNSFGGASKASLQCDNQQYVSGVFTCWSKDSNNLPGSQIDCPPDVVSEDTCSYDTLEVTALD